MTYKPVSEHGISAPLDNFLGCHDLSSFPGKGIVGAACGEQAQVWNIDRRTGLPDTAHPRWAYDQPNVDFWHSATFSWDGKIANFIDESFGDGCPTVTTKTGGLDGPPRVFETGNMFFFETRSGRLLSEFRNAAADERQRQPDQRQVLLVAPRHPGAVERPLPAGQRVLPRRLLGDRLQRSHGAEGDRVRRPGRARTPGRPTRTRAGRGAEKTIPVYSNDGLSRNYGTAAEPRYPEAAYGFQRFSAASAGRRSSGSIASTRSCRSA